MAVEEGIFPHQCINPDCTTIVQFDDEPWCFTHSPDEGSSLAGWSAKAVLTKAAEEIQWPQIEVSRNVFEGGGGGAA